MTIPRMYDIWTAERILRSPCRLWRFRWAKLTFRIAECCLFLVVGPLMSQVPNQPNPQSSPGWLTTPLEHGMAVVIGVLSSAVGILFGILVTFMRSTVKTMIESQTRAAIALEEMADSNKRIESYIGQSLAKLRR